MFLATTETWNHSNQGAIPTTSELSHGIYKYLANHYGDNWGKSVPPNRHVGSKTLHQLNPPVLNWRCRLTQLDLHEWCKTVVCGEVNEIKHKGQTSLIDNKQCTSAARRRNLSFSASSCRAASTSFTNAFHFSCTDATISSYTQPTHRCTSPQLTACAHTRTRTCARTHTHTHV